MRWRSQDLGEGTASDLSTPATRDALTDEQRAQDALYPRRRSANVTRIRDRQERLAFLPCDLDTEQAR